MYLIGRLALMAAGGLARLDADRWVVKPPEEE
jgi:hypothetical protein